MRRHVALGWLTAILLVLALAGPTAGRAAAQDDQVTAAPEESTAVTVPLDGQTVPDELPADPATVDPALPADPAPPDATIEPADPAAEPTTEAAPPEVTATAEEPAADPPAVDETPPAPAAEPEAAVEPAFVGLYGSITFTNVDDQGNPLAGGFFGVAEGAGPAVTWLSQNSNQPDGVMSFTNLLLPAGADTDFCVTQIDPPDGYTATETARTYTLTANALDVTGDDWANDPLPGQIIVYTRDPMGAELADIGVTLFEGTCTTQTPGTAE